MPDAVETKRPRNRITPRVILLVLALLSLPLCCLGGIQVTAILPLPGIFNLFKEEVEVVNATDEALYLMPITTTRGYPQVIYQTASLRQCHVEAAPGASVSLTYDAADFPLDGVTVCREGGICRLLKYDYGQIMRVGSYQALPELDVDWQEAAQDCKPFNVRLVLFPVLALLPLGLFTVWVVLTARGKKETD
jgi:hypothetical protein